MLVNGGKTFNLVSERIRGFNSRLGHNAISTEYCGLCLNNVDAGMLHKGRIDLAVRVSDSKMR